MRWLNRSAPVAQKSFADCSGCSLCLLVCPTWRGHHDIAMTPHGRAKAMQHGARAVDMAASIESCTLCGACVPMCPEKIDLIGMTLDLRRELVRERGQSVSLAFAAVANSPRVAATRLLLPDPMLRQDGRRLAQIERLLGGTEGIESSTDDGADISLALEAGVEIPLRRLERFLAPLRRMQELVVADGLLLRQLSLWLPAMKIISLGEALSRLEPVRRNLRATDLYVIEPRAYHANHQRLVGHYDRLRSASGCTLSLDLQRMAIPVTNRDLPQSLGAKTIDDAAQIQWLLHGRKMQRIVVESLEDRAVLESVAASMNIPVAHLADLAEETPSENSGRPC